MSPTRFVVKYTGKNGQESSSTAFTSKEEAEMAASGFRNHPSIREDTVRVVPLQ